MKKQEKNIKQPKQKLPQLHSQRRTVSRPALFHRKGSRNS